MLNICCNIVRVITFNVIVNVTGNESTIILFALNKYKAILKIKLVKLAKFGKCVALITIES